MEKLIKILFWVGVILILAVVVMMIKAHYEGCSDCQTKLYQMMVLEEDCSEALESFRNGSLIFEDDDVRVIKFDKIKEENN